MEKPREYVWYCPRPSCHGILMKTDSPILVGGKIGCRRCSEIHTTEEIMVGNRKNVARFLEYLTKAQTRWSMVAEAKPTADY